MGLLTTTLKKWEYLASYGDLINAFHSNVDPASAALNHYNTFVVGGTPGGTEVRSITFSAWEYLASYGDLMQAFGSDNLTAAKHYVAYGFGEGRNTTAFDAQAYLNNYADLSAAFGATGATALEKAAEHYVVFGRAEQRNDYVLTADATSVNEGSTVHFTLDTHDLAQGTQFDYSLSGSGITVDDLADSVHGSLSGTAIVGADGKAVISVNLAADILTEGAETLILTIDDHTKSVTVNDTSILDPVGTFTLTGDTDVKTLSDHITTFIAPKVRYDIGGGQWGDNRINSLQDEDSLTGSGANASLTVTLGDYNDDGSSKIAPHLTNIKTVNLDTTDTAGSNMTLDLQDSDAALTDVNITRISSGDSDVINMHKEAVNLSVSNSHDVPNITFTYLNQELTAVDTVPGGTGGNTVSLTLNNVYADLLTLGSNGRTQQIEHINLISNGDPSINLVDLNPDNNSSTNQSLHITANGELILGEDLSVLGGYVPAVPTVLGYPAAGQSAGHVFPVTGLAGHDLNIIEHDYAFTFDTVASLNVITVTGSGDVTLGSVGSADAFLLDGTGATGDIAVNISNAAADPLAIFRTGAGDDTVLVDRVLTGFYGSQALWGEDYVDGTGVHTFNNDITLAGKIYTNDGSDVVLANDLDESYSNPLWRTVIDTGSGADTVVVGTLFGGPGQAETADYNGALISLGEGNDAVTANNLQEEAQIDAGVGNDVINLTTTLYQDGTGTGAYFHGYTVVAGDSTGLTADGHGAEVLAGAGDDQINFLFTGTALHDLNGDSVIEGYVDGGTGNDSITVNSNKDLDLVHGNTSNTKAITGVETLTLNSTTAWNYDGSQDRADDFNGLTNGTRTIVGNDDDGLTADFTVDRSEFDSALATINLNHQDGVILNIAHEHLADFVAYGGDAAVDTLTNLLGTEQINLTALETYTNEGAGYDGSGVLVTGTGAAADTLGTVYGAGGVQSVCDEEVPFTADLTVNLDLATGTGTGDVAHVTINDNATTSIYSDLRTATTVLNSDFSINDSGTDYESLSLAVNGNHNHGVDLNNDFDTSLTVTGDGAVGSGNLTLINVDATTINTTGYNGNVYIGVESAKAHNIRTGSGSDIVRIGDATALDDFSDYVNLGGGNDIVIINGLGTGAVNHGGMTNGDTLIGGSGYDTLAIGGATSTTGSGSHWYGVSVSETELQRVSGFEAIQLSVGQAEPIYYDLILADSVFAQNGVSTNNTLLPDEKVLDIVNNNLNEYNLVVGHDNEVSYGSGHWTQLGEVTESDVTINLLEVGINNQITYSGATHAEGEQGSGACIVDHGSDDRFIFNDANLDGGDTINGGANDGDGTSVLNADFRGNGAYDWVNNDIESFYTHFSVTGTGLGNSDVIEIQNDAEVTSSSDLLHVKNVGVIAFNNVLGSNQTLILDLSDTVVDAMVDSLHTASTVAGERETLVVYANEGWDVDQSHAAQLWIDGSALTAKSELFIQLDDKDYGLHAAELNGSGNYTGDGTGSTLYGGTFGYDDILGGAGNDYINGVTENDMIDGGAGTGDTIGFTTYYSDWDNDHIQNVEVIDVWTDANHDFTGPLSDNIYVDLTEQTEAFTINVHEHQDDNLFSDGNILWAGSGNDTIHIYDYHAAVHGYVGDDVINVMGSGTWSGDQSGESIYGGLGNDLITGGIGDDQIWAYEFGIGSTGSGDDTITGGVGNDTIYLNSGSNSNNDWVNYAYGTGDGVDTIYNFTAGSGAEHDHFAFTGTGDTAGLNINGGLVQLANLAGGAVVAGAGIVTVTNVYAGTLATSANILSALTTTNSLTDAAGDVYYVAVDNGTDSAIARVSDTDGTLAAGDITIIAHLMGVANASTLIAANFPGFI